MVVPCTSKLAHSARELTTRHACRAALRKALQDLFAEIAEPALFLADPALLPPLTKCYLGEPDNGFAEMHLPVAHAAPLGAHGLDAAARAALPKCGHVVLLVRGHPAAAQLAAQAVLEMQACAPGLREL